MDDEGRKRPEDTNDEQPVADEKSTDRSAAEILVEERERFIGWLRASGIRGDAEDVLADAILRAVRYARPANDVVPRAAAWQHLRLARLEYWRAVGRRKDVIELETEHPHEPPDTRMATPAELVALRQFATRVVEVARERLGGRSSMLVALEARVGPLFGRPGMTPQEMAARLGIQTNRVYKICASVERLLAQIGAELLEAA